MQYFVAIKVSTVNYTDATVERSRVHVGTEYIRAFNKQDAEEIAEGFNSISNRTYRDGPFKRSRSAEVCVRIKDVSSRAIYLTMSDVEMITSEFTRPPSND